MTVDLRLVAVPAPEAGELPDPYSVAWWESRTAEELRDIINRGFAGGPQFRGAVAEAERRARDETRRLREIAAMEAIRQKKRRMIVVGAIVASILVTGVIIAM